MAGFKKLGKDLRNLGRKGGSGSEKDVAPLNEDKKQKRRASDVTTKWTLPWHDPDARFPDLPTLIKEGDLYGPNFTDTTHDPNLANIVTGEVMSKPHHCTEGDRKGHAHTHRCFMDGHTTYCHVWEFRDGFRTICGVRIKTRSGGCSQPGHETREGCVNFRIKLLVEGKIPYVTGREINDPVLQKEWDDERANEAASQARIEDQEAKIEEGLEQYVNDGDTEQFHNEVKSTYEIYKNEKAVAKTEAAVNKKVEDLTRAAIQNSKFASPKAQKKEPGVFAKLLQDTRAQMRAKVTAGPSAEAKVPENPRLEELDAKKARGGKGAKPGATTGRGLRGNVDGVGKKRKKHLDGDKENQAPA